MQLFVISSAVDIGCEAAIINCLFSAGLCRFHLRKPESSAKQICALLNGIDDAFYRRIALHQHHELASAYGITGLHYTERSRKQTTPETLESQRAQGYQLSTSIHDPQLVSSLTSFEYVFYGPVFNSISKPGYQSCIKPGFKLNKEHSCPAIIAIGGIEVQHLQTVRAIGFDGAAVLGAIWGQPEKAEQTFKYLQASMPE